MGKPKKKRVCHYCGKEYTGGGRHASRKYCTHACYSKAVVGIKRNTEHMIGERNWKWNGGSSRAYKTGYWSRDYQKWRNAVFKRDKYMCKLCGCNGYMEAHHIKSFTYFPELRFDIDNGLTLCKKCHRLIHKTFGAKIDNNDYIKEIAI